MKRITEISNDARQSLTPQLSDNDNFVLNLNYSEQNLGWYFDIIYGDKLNLVNRRITISPNLLRAYKNNIPFGLACLPINADLSFAKEPFFIDDFTSNRAALYILTFEELESFEESIFTAS